MSLCCEGNLSNAFADALDKMQEKKLQLELLNERNFTWNMEVIDFHNYLGVNIDRKTNKKNNLKVFAPFMMDLPNITMHTNANPLQAFGSLFKNKGPSGAPIIDGLTLEVVAKIRTNLKLNVKVKEGGSSDKLIDRSKEIDDELHFVKFEGFYPSLELDPKALQSGI